MRNQITPVLKIIGILVTSFSFTYLIPIIISYIYHDGQAKYFFITFLSTFALGLMLWLPCRKTEVKLKTRDGFLIVSLFWTTLSCISALPLIISPAVDLRITHALFEATSGFTTTGATVLTHIQDLPKSILWYRTQLHFFGGMGIIILAVAIMPLLGMGGLALFKVEVSGPFKEDNLTPRIAQTARNLWSVYLILLAACIIVYYIGGMDLFDAITHGFTTVATAGFSNYDDSLGHFKSKFIDMTAIIFMFISSINFTTHFLAFRQKKLRLYLESSELRAFAFICLIAITLIAIGLYHFEVFDTVEDIVLQAAFAVISMITTTGLTITDFSSWPSYLPILIVFITFIGGCSGSTAGGMKVIRVILLTKQAMREIKLLIHPHGKFPIRLNKRVVHNDILGSVWAFLGIYAFSTAILTLVMTAFGLSPLDAFSAVAACLNITGPGLGAVSSTYGGLPDGALSTLMFTMILGRLEIFTLFVLVTPSFWKH